MASLDINNTRELQVTNVMKRLIEHRLDTYFIVGKLAGEKLYTYEAKGYSLIGDNPLFIIALLDDEIGFTNRKETKMKSFKYIRPIIVLKQDIFTLNCSCY